MTSWTSRLRAPLVGALIGLPVLGAGGRLAMHGVSLWVPGAQRVVSVQGTITVLLLGLVSGLAGGIIYAVLELVMPRQRFARAILFAAVLAFLLVRGLHPLDPVRVMLFGPVMLAYGVSVERWGRRREPRVAAVAPNPGESASPVASA